MAGLFDRFRRRRSNPDAEAQARALLERATALHQDFDQAPAVNKIPRLLEAIQGYRAVLSILIEQDFSVNWAATQYNLGVAYADLPTRDRGQNLAAAISCFQAALRVWTERDFPVDWAMAQNSLGAAYADLPTRDRGQNLATAIACYQATLRVRTEQDFPVEWARTQNSLGAAYAVLPTGDRGQNLATAIACFQATLRVRTEQDFPMEWAGTQANLGTAYQSLPMGDPGANVAAAIACYRAALLVYTERSFPVQWAITQNNLGSAYVALPTGDRGANVEAAIACYRAALRVRTEQDFPAEWARVQNNLGFAYWNLPTGDRRANVEVAIACYRGALGVLTEQDFPVDWAMAENNLGSAYADLPTGEQGTNLAEAIACHRAALRVYTERDFPVEWARTQNNLGSVYAHIPTDNRGESLDGTITCYQAALRVYTERDFPVEWARVQNNLGSAYANLPTGERGTNLAEAIAYYQAALQVRTAETLPFDCLGTLHNLSLLHYREQQWREALATCDEGVRVLESVRTAALTATERTRLLSEHAGLFDRAVICGVESEQFADAIVYAERGKTRNLIEMLTRRDVKPRQVSDAGWRAYQDRLAEVQALERQLVSSSAHDSAAVALSQHIRDDLARVRADLERFEAQFRAADPDYLPTAPSLTFADIQAVVCQANAVLVEFRVTEAGTFVFLLSGDDTDVTEGQVVCVPEFTTNVLDEMLAKRENGALVDGWLVKYYQWRQGEGSRQAWMDCLDQVTGALHDQLLHPVRERLQTLYPKAQRLILVPNKGLNLLPLHAAHAGTNGQRRYWLDDYEILYAPSCAVLRRCLQREAERGERETLFAVQNPDLSDEDWKLPFSDWEVEEATPYFRTTHILPGAEATLTQVKRLIATGHEVLLSCHGTYDLTDVFASHLFLHGDDRLLLSDILQLDLSHAWLIVLSACETAISDFRDVVDEVQGLHTAFLIARAPTAVGSLWSVHDLSTALLMQRFHANLYTYRMDKASALCEAQRWLRDLPVAEARRLLSDKRQALERINARERLAMIDLATARFDLEALAAAHGGKPFAHPYWWAAFQCVGAGWQPERRP